MYGKSQLYRDYNMHTYANIISKFGNSEECRLKALIETER